MKQKPWADRVESAKKKIDSEQYASYLHNVELRGIFLRSLKADFPLTELQGKGTFDFSESVESISVGDATSSIECEFLVKARSGRRQAARIRATYSIQFATKERMPEEFFVLFAATSLPINVFPYVRELTNGLFSRTHLPPLVLPLRKFLLPKASRA